MSFYDALLYSKLNNGGGNKVTGVKGDAEENYRTGDVNMTPANIGAYSKTEIDNLLDSCYHAAGSKACAELVASLLIKDNLGNVYNVTDSGTTTADFVEGAGKTIDLGSDVVIVNVGTNESPIYKFNVLSGFVDLSNYVEKEAGKGLFSGSYDDLTNKPTLGTASDKDSTANITDGSTDLAESGAVFDRTNVEKINDGDIYLFRQSKAIGDRSYLNRIYGGSFGVNQLVSITNIQATTTVNEVTFTKNNDGSITLNGTASFDILNKNIVYVNMPRNNHVILTRGRADLLPTGLTLGIGGYGSRGGLGYFVKDATASNWNNYIIINIAKGTSFSNYKIYPQMFDLTLMFGSTIADYVYSLEQETAGSGVEWLKSYGFFTKDYYPYNTGELQSVKTSAKNVVGFNQFDVTTAKVGFVDDTSGVFNPASGYKRTDYIKVIPNTSYYVKSSQTSGQWGAWYDSNKEFISGINSYANTVITSPSNASYVALTCEASGTGNVNTFCFNISDTEKNGTYEPYTSTTYSLGNYELRGVPQLINNQFLSYEGDVLYADGSITRKYGIVDLGSLTWGSYDEYFYTNVLNTTVKKPSSNSDTANIICAKYKTTSVVNRVDKSICLNSAGTLVITDSSYTDAATLTTAMSGVYLVYELAIATSEKVLPIINPQLSYPNGTDEFIDNREFPIPVSPAAEYVKIPDWFRNVYFNDLVNRVENQFVLKQLYFNDTTSSIGNISTDNVNIIPVSALCEQGYIAIPFLTNGGASIHFQNSSGVAYAETSVSGILFYYDK